MKTDQYTYLHLRKDESSLDKIYSIYVSSFSNNYLIFWIMFMNKNILLIFTTRSTVISLGTDNSEYKIRFKF